jgi:hypothetical protein
MVSSPNAIPSLIVPNLAPKEVLVLIQDEHEDAMEDSEWPHKGSRWCCKVDALVLMHPNGCFISTWNEHTPFGCKPRNQNIHLFVMGGLGNKITIL